MNARFISDEILEKLESITRQLEKADGDITKVRLEKNRKIREYSKILKELYKKNIELVKKLQERNE